MKDAVTATIKRRAGLRSAVSTDYFLPAVSFHCFRKAMRLAGAR